MLSRRTFLRQTSVAAAVGVASLQTLVAACVPASPAPGAPAAKPGSNALKLPTYVAFNGPPPDQPGSLQGVQPVYVNYPKSPLKSVSTPPGKGGEINALTNTVNAPPPT